MKLENVIAEGNGKTVYRSGEYAVKVFGGQYSKADVLNEALNSARIEQTGLNIPKIIEVKQLDGKWAIVSELIEGRTLDRLMESEADSSDEYLELFVDLQTEVHSKKSPALNRLKDKISRRLDDADIDANTRFDLLARLESMPNHDKVCHGDFNPCNVIINADGAPYIVDWAHAAQGNASADAAQTYLMFKLGGRDALAEKYLDMFCRKSNTDKSYIQKWLPIVAAVQSVRCEPQERELLRRWSSVIEYQ